jgi:hypothetical protein
LKQATLDVAASSVRYMHSPLYVLGFVWPVSCSPHNTCAALPLRCRYNFHLDLAMFHVDLVLFHLDLVMFYLIDLQQDQGRCWLISEFMPGGTLAQWLHVDKGPLGPNKPLLQRAQRALDVSDKAQYCCAFQQLCWNPATC